MVTTRNPFIDHIEAPDLATKIVAKDGSDDAGHVTVEDVLSVPVTATGSTEARSLADRFGDTLNVKDFGAVGDGVTDDRDAIAAAVAAARGKNLHFPEGQYLIDTDGGSITLQEVGMTGEFVRDNSEDLVFDQGTVLHITGTTNSPFLMRRGVSISKLGFYYPDQIDSATPTAYPPTIDLDYSDGPINFVHIRENVVFNAYRFLRMDHVTGANGFIWIENNAIQGIHRAIEITKNAEIITIRGNSFSCGIWLAATEAGLREYMRANAVVLEWDEGDGIIFTNNMVFGHYQGIVISAGRTQLLVVSNNMWDQIRYPVYVEGVAHLLISQISGNVFTPFNGQDATQAGRAITFVNTPGTDPFTSLTGADNVAITGNIFSYCAESHIVVGGTGLGRLTITGNHFENMGYLNSADAYAALVLANADKNVVFTGNYVTGRGDAFGYGIVCHAIGNLHIGGNVFESCTYPYTITSAGNVTSTGNASYSTFGGVSENIVSITNDHWQTGNLWDKPSGHSTKPAFLARKSAAQTISTGDLTSIVFGTEIFDRGGDFASPTFTAPRAGRYRFSWALLHDDSGTDGDRWALALNPSSGASLSMMYTMVSDYNSVGSSGIMELAAGVTVTLQAARLTGAGQFVTHDEAAYNYFCGEYIE